MLYTYPRPQTLYNDTLFLMAETVDSNKFDSYQIPHQVKDKMVMFQISDAFLKEAIGRGIVLRQEKKGAFHDKPFYRIPINIQLKLI